MRKNIIDYQKQLEMPKRCYGKNQVTEFKVTINGKRFYLLRSYRTIVAAYDIEEEKLYIRGYYSQTTTRHIGVWLADELGIYSDEYYNKNRKQWNRKPDSFWSTCAELTYSR